MNLQPDKDEKTFPRAFSIFDPENAALYAKASEELVTLNTEFLPVLELLEIPPDLEFLEVNEELSNIEGVALVDDFGLDPVPVQTEVKAKACRAQASRTYFTTKAEALGVSRRAKSE